MNFFIWTKKFRFYIKSISKQNICSGESWIENLDLKLKVQLDIVIQVLKNLNEVNIYTRASIHENKKNRTSI